ncbi:MAG: hypothetical protein ACI8R4_001540 [Paracoccaceae bacterium]|jgi:hypothetical protein
MIRAFAHAILTALLLWPAAAQAQIEPRLSVELPEGEIIVGQPIVLRLKLLVPTWMPKPPNWPDFEVPSLLVRLPERASSPISETIEGETWSGISRAYRLYPLIAGPFELPVQQLVVSYADPGGADPVETSLTVKAIRFTATLPKGAEGVDPLIIAQDFSLTQQIDGGPQLQTGDAVQRIVTASIKGTTPILIPALIPNLPPNPANAETASHPLRAYPKEPVVTDSEDRGVLSGTRRETVTYMAQAGGDAALPEIAVQWFNLDSGKVEIATLDGMALSIAVPPPPPPGPADYARWAMMLVAALIAIWLFARFLWPRLRATLQGIRSSWVTSESYAARQMRHALRAESLGEIYAALDQWAGFYPGMGGAERSSLDAALADLGATRFAKTGPSNDTSSRRKSRDAFDALRAAQRATAKKQTSSAGLAPLNPFR